MNHQLHKTMGKIIKDNFSEEFFVILDQAYGGKQNIPLFSSRKKTRSTEICDVDILILKNGKIKVIFEIEESDVGPTQVCGKFLTPALSSYHISRDNKTYAMDKSVLFLQILDTSKLKSEKTKKVKQWENIEKSIKRVIPIDKSRVDQYKLFYGKDSEFEAKEEKRDKLIRYIRRNLK